MGRSLLFTFLWIFLALLFNLFIWFTQGSLAALDFFTAYLLEKTLSIDNLFLFFMIFSSFKLPLKEQKKVLYLGILGAILFRALFIFLGLALVERFSFLFYLFGAFLLFIAIKMGTKKETPLEEQLFYRLAKKYLPLSKVKEPTTFFIKEKGKWKATSLLLALVLVESTDILFALDSIPAVFAITLDPFIVYTSNLFAILGLRSLYVVVVQSIAKFSFLQNALAYILGFIGIKMLLHSVFVIPTYYSLLVIFGILLISFFYKK
jgi:tellurite resistance protein TerC